jgi:molybdopterin-guanine dinucleotide biosynthesis protein A
MVSTEQVPESLQGVVLAGGDSTRFGANEDKALARIDSERILNRIVTVLEQVTHREPVIVLRTPKQRVMYANAVSDTSVRFVFDAPDHDGPLAGLCGAAAALEARWLFCCGCDMPLLSSTAVRWLVDRIPHDQPTTQQQVDAVAIQYPDGVVEPLHTVYRRESIIERHNSLPRRAGPRMLLSELDTVSTVSIADAPDCVPLERSTTNINTREELEAVQNH